MTNNNPSGNILSVAQMLQSAFDVVKYVVTAYYIGLC